MRQPQPSLSELLQRELEQRYAGTIQRFRTARSQTAVAALWADAVAAGDVCGALWASSPIRAAMMPLQEAICRDMHMLQHQAGAAVRARSGSGFSNCRMKTRTWPRTGRRNSALPGCCRTNRPSSTRLHRRADASPRRRHRQVIPASQRWPSNCSNCTPESPACTNAMNWHSGGADGRTQTASWNGATPRWRST